jgi:hypothetical protein
LGRIPFGARIRFAFMNSTFTRLSCRRWLVAVAATEIGGVLQFSNVAESPPANTNAPAIALDAIVADVLEHNPELNQLRGQPWTNATKVEPVNLAFTSAPETDALLAGTQTNNFELQMRRVELEQQKSPNP